MIGKTNVNARNTTYTVDSVTVTQDEVVLLPADYGLDYFDQVVVNMSAGNALNAMCCNRDINFDSTTYGSNITAIPEYLMYKYSHLGSVLVPSTVQTVGQYAFALSSVTTVRLESATAQTMKNAFFNCASLHTVYVNCPNLDLNYTFSGCGELQNVALADVHAIDSFAFQNCKKLAQLIVPANCIRINTDAFNVSQNGVPIAPLHVTFLRHYDSVNNVSVTDVKNEAFRSRTELYLYAPLDSLCAYRKTMRNYYSSWLSNLFAYADFAAGATLPATLSQTQSNVSESYSLVWYNDRDRTQSAGSTATTAGRYYAVVTLEV